MTQPPPFVLPPLTPPMSASIEPDTVEGSSVDPRQSIWSGSQISDIPKKTPLSQPREDQDGSIVEPPGPRSHVRSRSFSTVDDHQRTSTEQGPGTFKIVIDRSDSKTRPQTAAQSIPSTLEVPIPHYRLGTPRFSVQGTPILRSSTYTRTSVSDNLRSSAFVKGDYERLFPAPPGMVNSDIWYRGRSHVFDDKSPIIRAKSLSGVTRSSAALPSPSIRSMSAPVEPSLFDALLPLMDDPSVVRYSQRTGEITAATPARIVAQISSENFMDYELVSDFFLTFRSYLTTGTLLALLLARLHWAINRLQPDGRIIRIRTFAALRHWILNYFMDDFVVDRELRVQFCDKINAMHTEVRARTSGGHSDLKIILDLKRCWVGRCALYWDDPDLTLDVHQDADLVPGGMPGSRDISKTRSSQVLTQEQTEEQRILDPEDAPGGNTATQVAINTWFEGETEPAPAQRARQNTNSTLHTLPISPISEQSIQALSCSVPARPFRRHQPPPTNYRAPHPIPVQAQGGMTSPATVSSPPPKYALGGRQRLSHTHKRSGSFTDSIRDDRSPLSAANAEGPSQPLLYGSPYGGSLIRGNVYPPSQPFVDVLAPTSPVSQIAQFNFGSDVEQHMDSGFRPGTMATPAMKTIIGSIRRALSSKQSGSHSSSSGPDGAQSAPSLKTKSSNLPANVVYHSEGLKEKRSVHGLRHHMRIDLLCAEIAQSYQTAVKNEANPGPDVEHGIGIALGNEREQPSPSPNMRRRSHLDVPMGPQRLPSQMTTGSQSIVIIDDTGLDLSAMSGALPNSPIDQAPADSTSDTLTMAARVSHKSEDLARVFKDDLTKEDASQIEEQPQEVIEEDRVEDRPPSLNRDWSTFSRTRRSASRPRRSSSLDRGQARSAGSASTMLRRYASYQSGIAKHVANNSTDANTTSASAPHSSGDVFDKPPARMLRRRPGGDLRHIKNVHDLEPIVRPQSTGSITTNSDSLGGSLLVMARNRAVGAPLSPPADSTQNGATRHKLSLINTHSSLHVRPSFEAAVAGFAAIPDDEDGGLEATLLKLEGTYEKRYPDLSSPDTEEHTTLPQEMIEAASVDKRKHHLVSNMPTTPPKVAEASAESSAARAHLAVPSIDRSHTSYKQNPPVFGLGTESFAGSEESYSSVPLLERGLSDESMKKPQPSPQSDVSVPRPLFSRNASENKLPIEAQLEPPSSHPSIEIVDETESMKKIPAAGSMPDRSPTAESFLLDEDQDLSDLSSELSVDVIDPTEASPRAYLPLAVQSGAAISGNNASTHPLTHPPTPPTVFGHGTPVNPQVNLTAYQQRPLTPDPSPTQGNPPHMGPDAFNSAQPSKIETKALPKVASNSGHIPFILACDSEVLAQQFTLVEKAALAEIEWRDLVDMRWKSHPTPILNWVDYLMNIDQKGIEIAVSRFNIMVKWALSEIVMTQNIVERARVITKYIHVAAHARKAHNYATMLQLTIALSSIDCTRLTRTWELVPATEKQLLKDMETLIQPIRNFHDLRVEMETANLQEGCIPFVGKLPPSQDWTLRAY